jgi:hypothetical protein
LGPALRPPQFVPAAFYLEVKWPGREPDYWPLCSAEINESSIPLRAVVVFTWTHLPLLLQRPADVYLTSCILVTGIFFSWTKTAGVLIWTLLSAFNFEVKDGWGYSYFHFPVHLCVMLKPNGKFAFAVIYFEFSCLWNYYIPWILPVVVRLLILQETGHATGRDVSWCFAVQSTIWDEGIIK